MHDCTDRNNGIVSYYTINRNYLNLSILLSLLPTRQKEISDTGIPYYFHCYQRGERRAGAVGGRVSQGRGLALAVTTTTPFGRGSRGLVLLGAEAPANRLSPMEEGFDERFGVSV